MFLPLTITGIIVTEQAFKPLCLGKALKDLPLLGTGIQFTPKGSKDVSDGSSRPKNFAVHDKGNPPQLLA